MTSNCPRCREESRHSTPGDVRHSRMGCWNRMVGMTTWLKRHFRIALMLFFGLAVLPTYLRAFKLSTPSMAPSINIGDSFLVNKAAYFVGSPKRGDMVQLMVPEIRFPII